MISLELPTAPPSLNQWQRYHWAKRARVSQSMHRELSQALALDGHGAQLKAVCDDGRTVLLALKRRAKGRRSVRITRRGSRTLDDDNLRGGCKPLVDALVKVGLIEDDTPALVTVEYEQARGAGCRVEVWG